jgi:hypothetical protein
MGKLLESEMNKTISVVFMLTILFISSCQWGHKRDSEFKDTQMLIDETVAAHPEIVRLTIHAVPPEQTQSRIIACNIREKIGKLDDTEDLEAVKTKTTIVLKEGDNLDVTAPILDKAGNAIAQWVLRCED